MDEHFLLSVLTGEIWSDTRSSWIENIERPVEAQTDGHATENTPLNQDNSLQYLHNTVWDKSRKMLKIAKFLIDYHDIRKM